MATFGFVDEIENGTVRGWTYDEETCAPVPVSVYLDGVPIRTILGTTFREDVREAGTGDGNCGFECLLPLESLDVERVLSVCFTHDGVPLSFGIQRLQPPRPLMVDLYGEALAKGIWGLDAFEQTDGETVARGWALPPFALPYPFTIVLNGELASAIDQFARVDLSDRLGLPASMLHGFEARWAQGRSKTGTRIELQLARRHDGTIWNPAQVAARIDVDSPLPDAARRKRVGGVEDEETFKNVGASVFASLDRASSAYFGRSLDGSRSLLDWGCGCGRVFRYLSDATMTRVCGIDIDADTVRWCRTHYPNSNFETTSTRPPTPYAANTFDTVIGVSVLTHLSKASQDAWLRELHRITAPGAAVFLTVLGETAWLLAGLPQRQYIDWRQSGYWSAGKNFDLDTVVVDSTAYDNCFITKRYIFERWTTYFDVLDILDGAIANHQDLVVLRRK